MTGTGTSDVNSVALNASPSAQNRDEATVSGLAPQACLSRRRDASSAKLQPPSIPRTRKRSTRQIRFAQRQLCRQTPNTIRVERELAFRGVDGFLAREGVRHSAATSSVQRGRRPHPSNARWTIQRLRIGDPRRLPMYVATDPKFLPYAFWQAIQRRFQEESTPRAGTPTP
jgi:hypothetical protein